MNALASLPLFDPRPLPVPPVALGESPLWHPQEHVLYWVDIPGRALHRCDPARQLHEHWGFDDEVACCAPLLGGGLLLGLRNGLWRFDTTSGQARRLAKPPYDPKLQRFNDGKADPQGRMWVGTLTDSREFEGALYRFCDGELRPMLHDVAVSNGLAWSPDGRTMYWSDTKRHTVYAFDFESSEGELSRRREFARFAPRDPALPLAAYGGRPDGAAVDSQGCYWVAMYEGARLLRLSPEGRLLQEVRLPVVCPTMPCFGGPDLKTLFVTSVREKRPADELARFPWSGCVLQMRVDVPGLPANFAAA
jgi:sugar lactone lactonase YvrE